MGTRHSAFNTTRRTKGIFLRALPVLFALLAALYNSPTAAQSTPTAPVEATGIQLTGLAEVILKGNFEPYQAARRRLHDANYQPGEINQRADILAQYFNVLTAYVTASNAACGHRTVGDPVAFNYRITTETRNGWGTVVESKEQETDTIIASRDLVDLYDTAERWRPITMLVSPQTAQAALTYHLTAVSDMRSLFETWQCQSPGIVQFQDNLIRFFAGSSSVQEEYETAMRPLRSNEKCRELLAVNGIAATSATCPCIRSTLAEELRPDRMDLISDEFVEDRFLLYTASKVRLADRIRACYGQ
jgi:hypothetical protein